MKKSDAIIYQYPTKYGDGRVSCCKLPETVAQLKLNPIDYNNLAEEFNLEVALIKAVIAVESSGSGFLLNEPHPSRPKILFEAHWFYKLTPQPVSKIRPDLSCPSWNPKLYKGGSAEWTRLLDAMTFDEKQALKSASWGLGQVMGFNYFVAGCNSIEQFIEENFAGEYWQARHMMNFVKNNNLLDELKRKDWAGFARGYNGTGYKRNQYDIKLAQAYTRALSGT